MDKTTEEYANKLAEEIKNDDLLGLFDEDSFRLGYMTAIEQNNVKGLIALVEHLRFKIEAEHDFNLAQGQSWYNELELIDKELEKARKETTKWKNYLKYQTIHG